MNAIHNKSIEDEINQEEVFKDFKDLKADPNAIFVEYNPSLALEKLTNIKNASPAEQYGFILFQKKINYFRLSYAKHLAELLEIIDDEGIEQLQTILEQFVF